MKSSHALAKAEWAWSIERAIPYSTGQWLKLLPATYARDPVRQDDTITIAVDFVIHLRAPFATGEMLIGDRPALALGLLGILDTPLNRDRRV